MLIEFSVSNFRSFRERQTLSMVAAPKLRKLENTFKPELLGEKFPALLKACAVYGPNASGKTNLLKAIDAVCQIAGQQPSSDARFWFISPFRFDRGLADKPSTFEVHFIHAGMRYQFDLSATAERIHLERLRSFPRGKETLLFERRNTAEGDQYTFGGALEGGSDLHETWRKLTGSNALFLSQAVANSNEDLHQLRVPHKWLTHSVMAALSGMDSWSRVAQRLALHHETIASDISRFLKDLDVPISKLHVESVERPSVATAAFALMMGAEEASRTKNSASVRTMLTHASALGDADIRYEDESEGTKNLIGFWVPWSTRNPSERNIRCILAIDELDSSLHPQIVIALVKQHLASLTPSQLLFTTHDTHLMDAKLLRRDQVWLTERDDNGATQLRSIHDFEGRESEDVEKRYYEGRYRGLPLLRGD